MKITNSQVIKNGERELIDAITGDLDWQSIEQIVRDKHSLNIQDDVEYKQGDIVVHDNQVAYRLDFEVKMTLSVVFDREGNHLSLMTSDDLPGENEVSREQPPQTGSLDTGTVPDSGYDDLIPDAKEEITSISPENTPQEKISHMASHIAEMITEINEDE